MAGLNCTPFVRQYDILSNKWGAVHIEESVFIIVQNIRKSRRRPTRMGDMGIFSGLVFCADCGNKMYLCRANEKPEQAYYLCATYRKDRSLCTTHTIRNTVLHEIVLKNLREAIQYVSQHEAEFMQEAADISMRDRDAEFARKRDIEEARNTNQKQQKTA
ncbi:MAG: zinc ribbon domain-containing protein [Vescimonas sp.]|uniref:zinc ribbon domain-containing protein n=1 Tax=Vescimonas sp. TaxID=2892404 RepID=UPI002A9194D1|nr:zinc ribbon domain-containing protein [Vescimonas sp.]MDY5333547.1 zinc ribbon domain-containing protein [Vescimonas sp.]